MSDPRGKKWACYKCQNKFYDLKKSPVICPKCGANQAEKPAPKKEKAAPKPSKKIVKNEVDEIDDIDIDDVIDLEDDIDDDDDMMEVSQDMSLEEKEKQDDH